MIWFWMVLEEAEINFANSPMILIGVIIGDQPLFDLYTVKTLNYSAGIT